MASTPAAVGLASELRRAVAAGAWDAADRLIGRVPDDADDAVRRSVAAVHAHRRRWADAIEALESLSRPDASSLLRRTLYRNLVALAVHRPAAYRAVVGGREDDGYRVVGVAEGVRTVASVDAAGTATPLCGDPAGQVRRAADGLAPRSAAGDAVAMLSVGDGHVLAWLAANPPALFMTRQQAIYLIEPDARLLHACLRLHDYTGPLGPIEQPRVRWHVGPAWADTLRAELAGDRYLPFPAINVKQGASAAAIEPVLLSAIAAIGRNDTAAAVTVRDHYAALAPDAFAAALAGRAGRTPRVLLVTTRQSTVLQYSTRDAEAGFRRLGFETAVVIEPADHHVLTRSGLRRTLAEFLPDLVFQIDHHRFEHADVFPANLPFVNWVQDLLPHLMTPAAGRRLGAADFVLTPSRQRWVDDFAYPERQCLEFRKLTRVPERPRAWQSDEASVAYVSNWSRSPAALTAELLAGTGGVTRDVTAAACDRMTRLYAAGGSLESPGAVRGLLRSVLDDLRATADDALVRQTATRLFDRLNNALYRQQGLAWAADACRAAGLRLDIYGSGWDQHPRFAAYARGPVAYGPALEALTRRAGVNLILEPFMCLSHQRLLDALVAGGFCLARAVSANRTAGEWIDLIATAGGDAHSAADLRSRLGGGDVARFDANFAECERLDAAPGKIDHVATVRRMQQSGFFPERGQVLPLLDRMTFSTPAALENLLVRASRDAEWRSAVSTPQRRCIEGRYTYHAGMRRVVDFVVERLTEPAAALPRAA